jgi:predicted nucleic acid-binding protein
MTLIDTSVLIEVLRGRITNVGDALNNLRNGGCQGFR